MLLLSEIIAVVALINKTDKNKTDKILVIFCLNEDITIKWAEMSYFI